MNKKKCFIIMPISTPEAMMRHYVGNEDHFRHILNQLFIPAIDEAGFCPVSPNIEGSDLIHAEIIKNLIDCEMVLCDMSCLNPNVFFEYGIRTALNKPVCVIKDELTNSVPFDTSVIHYENYDSKLEVWNLKQSISKLAEHIKVSNNKCNGQNKLWRYFGL
ncbi:MAG: hypothetical protein MJE63_24395, partial [Proteobacteria bacterium]|nr:hypothetical protein [Pseudomonadota bacterium]